MLPYHLRPPSEGKSIKKKPDSAVADYRNGGPIQQAIQEDLLDVRGDFVRELGESVTDPAADILGASFAACKTIFRRRKVAALHTHFMPPRCDPAAYSQMIYAACLAMLPRQLSPPPAAGDSIQETDDSTRGTPPVVVEGSLTDAAFAFFSLYILHETNPLPRAENAKGFELMPVGIRNRTNNRRAFHRRTFRPGIRVCQSTMASFLYWREHARAVVSHPDAATLESRERRTAEDVLVVLERLWKQLDFVSYAGPRGLEAMASHPHYPYFGAATTASAPSEPVELDDSEEGADSTEIDSTLQRHMQEYLQCRRAIRFVPPTNARQRRRIESVQKALRPMFGDTTGPSLEETLQRLRHNFSATTVLQSKPRMVTFSIVESVGLPDEKLHNDAITLAGDDKDEAIPLDGASKSQGHGDDEPDSYELVLPLDTPAALRGSLEAAVQTLLEQDQMALMGNMVSTVAIPTAAELHDDGISTLAAPSVAPSVASTQTGVGRDLLVDLLGRVEETGSRRDRGSVASLPRRRSEFLEDAEVVTPRDTAAVHDLSDFSEEDDGNDALSAAVSSAVSSIGRRAIRELLESVPTSAKKAHSKKAKKAVPAALHKPRKRGRPRKADASVSSDASSQEFAPIKRRKRGRPRKDAFSVFSKDELSVFSGVNMEARSTTGKDALGLLLAKRHSKKDDFSVASETNTEARSTTGQDALGLLLAKRHSKKDDFSVASEANTEARSTTGQDALGLLLANRYSKKDDASVASAANTEARSTTGKDALGLLLAKASAKDDFSAASETNTEAPSTTGRDALGLLLPKQKDDFSVASEANTEAPSTTGNDALGLLLSKAPPGR
jgi:hypothetical protein